MAYEVPGNMNGNHVANADLTTSQYLGVVVNSSGKIAVVGAGLTILGVLQNKPNTDQAAQIMIDGVTKFRAGAAVAIGAKVMADATGRAITATATNQGVGIALTAAGAANEVISVQLSTLGTI